MNEIKKQNVLWIADTFLWFFFFGCTFAHIDQNTGFYF